ncbi:hypothetical protein KFE25_000637 [Diacronema lutheri]|uniref:PSP proline-rich domain-containing protein n=1 Tax=Diacronema lutheri TaxID=2081491 RepID=A0A8J5XEK0_DIALT|nr:hypothetical protein KFE25_000637 [Diacronema lutheri]
MEGAVVAEPQLNGTAHASARRKAEEARAAMRKRKKQHRKEVKRQQRTAGDAAPPTADSTRAPAADAGEPDEPGGSEREGVKVEYVSKRDEAATDPAFHELAKVFERFATAEQLVGSAPAPAGDGAAAEHAGADAGAGERGEDGLEEDEEKASARKLRKELRLSVAELKRSTDRPEVVEQWDVTAADPKLLVHLKAYRNAVPVPRHWAQKRAYLQGKRGIEKKPFQLPDFIAATGIEKIRQVVAEKEEAKKLKSKTRETTRPKMHRLDLDYQVLHDAFFKYQTKPKMTRHGEVYWEGKENEVHLREKRPGQLSADLRRALSMGDDPLTPPPFLVNMQRYGPPPSYPQLRVPGLNAPLPEGASYGTHPGGWGKPPVDELGTALYGNPFAPPVPAGGARGGGAGAGAAAEGVSEQPWGEPDSESEAESEEEYDDDAAAAGVTDDEIARGTSSLASVETGGTETPKALSLRKERLGVETPSSVAGADTPVAPGLAEPPRALYTVLEQKAVSVGAAAFGSAHTYAMPPTMAAAAEAQSSGQGGRRTKATAAGAVEVVLDPAELEDLDEERLKQRYESQVAANKRAHRKEDLSDLVEEHEARKRRKASQQGR